MISDTLERLGQYYGIHPHLDTAIRAIKGMDFTKMADGRHDIQGDEVFLNIMPTNLGSGSTWEAHHNYIDLQLVLENTETIAWAPVEQIKDFSGYDAQKDIMLSHDVQKGSPLVLMPGMFALFFPEDAHQPGIGTGQGRKAVFKIKAEVVLENPQNDEPGTVELKTERLLLRRFQQDDAQAMFDNWCSDPEVARYVTWDAHQDIEVTKAILADWIDSYKRHNTYHWGITKNGVLIGDIAVVVRSPRANSCEIGYCLSRAYWNLGIMTEALVRVMRFLFDEVGFQRIIIKHEAGNPASGRVMQKAGLQKEGLMRRAFCSKGQLMDLVQYAALKEEWMK